MIGYGNSMFLATHGILARSASGGGVDTDAQAFITAASITDPTQQSAINQLVVDLKGYGIWTKMKALYPFCGGTNAQHAWNLKDTSQYKITWYGGVTSSNLGVFGNGTNGYGDTFLANNLRGQNSNHQSVYVRTTSGGNNGNELAAYSTTYGCSMYTNLFGGLSHHNNSGATYSTLTTSQGGFFLSKRDTSTQITLQRNTTQQAFALNSVNNIASSFKLLRSGDFNGEYSNKNLAFASIGDGLTDTEAANFYTAVQAFQVTLGRSIGTQSVSDADAQAFVTNAGIVDQVEANAINNLVIGLKADSLWTKMKACYPMVGGSSSTMKYNLKNPLDTDAAFRLVFNGGWTFSSTGAMPNGTNAYADTFLIPNSSLTINSNHLSFYSRSNTNAGYELACQDDQIVSNKTAYIGCRVGGNFVSSIQSTDANRVIVSNSDGTGFYTATRISTTSLKSYKNGVLQGTNSNSPVNSQSGISILLSAFNYKSALGVLSVDNYSTKQCAFASIGDGLTDTDATNLNTRVTTFQTALNRNV